MEYYDVIEDNWRFIDIMIKGHFGVVVFMRTAPKDSYI